jgi:hypothetical protein
VLEHEGTIGREKKKKKDGLGQIDKPEALPTASSERPVREVTGSAAGLAPWSQDPLFS